MLQGRVKQAVRQRVDLINDPKEIIEDLELENFSIGHLEKSFKTLMSRLQFTLPDRLSAPITYFVISNFAANKIEVTDKNLVIQFDPRSLGLMS
jgi:hypothetical protein